MELRRSPTAVQQIALRYAREVFANGGVRFRARFAMYASALTDAQRRFLVEAAPFVEEGARGLRPPRRITVPRIEFNHAQAIVPPTNPSSIDRWVEELRGRVTDALTREVDRAQRVVLERGAASLIRIRIALRLTLRGPISM
jgi:hypothetical protein